MATPGQYSVTYDPDDEPTRPDGIADVSLAVITSVARQQDATTRRRLKKLVEAWSGLNTAQRTLLEELAVELTGR